MESPAHYAKAITAVIGAGVTAALGLVTPDDPAYVWLVIASAMLTALAVYVVPNRPAEADLVARQTGPDTYDATVYEADVTPPPAGYEPTHRQDGPAH